MMRLTHLLALTLLVAGCDMPLSADEKAADDAEAIEQVDAAQKVTPPIIAITPQPIAFDDLEKEKLLGASCAFKLDGSDQFVAVAMAESAVIKVDGALRVFAADRGSPALPLGAWTHYDGREHVIDLQIAGGDGSPSGEETTDWAGRLTIRDPYDRVVYSSPGTVQCGA
jgi:hypothetical protein